MKSKYLFPNYCKTIGWFLAVPAFMLGILHLYFEFEFSGLTITLPGTSLLGGDNKNNLTDELIAISLLIGLNLLAFSRRKVEDEWVSLIRLESLQWGIYVNTIVLLLAVTFVYGIRFLEVMAYNMFTPLIFFIIRFEYVMWVTHQSEKMTYEK